MIPVFKPVIDAFMIKAATDALELGWLGMGSYVREFEESLANYFELGPDRALIAVNTCTSALHLALRVAGVGPGDEVITPALNNIGDFQAIGMCGARPVFVDICDDDIGLNPELIERAITPKVKAIIALHYMGVPCRIDAILQIARKHGIRVIEDAAHATGTRVNGRRIGSYGDLSCFSFDAIKTLTCIDGGAVIVPNKKEAEGIYPARLLGMTQPNERLYSNSRAYQFDVLGQGFRYHLANLHASIGLSQLKQLDTFVANRREYSLRYNELLGGIEGLIVPQTDFADASVFHYVIRVTDNRRADLAAFLKSRGIDTGIHWLPGHGFTWLKSCRGANEIPMTDRIGGEILTLPLWSFMPDAVIEKVAGEIRAFFGRPPVVASTRTLDRAQLLSDIKQGNRADYEIPIEGFPGARLRPVTTANPRVDDVARLTAWRNRNHQSFLSEFTATEARTRGWLTGSVTADDSRILFMIEERSGLVLGYVGLAYIDWANSYGEADSVVRGERASAPGIMGAAVKSLMSWGRRELQLRGYGVRVLSDNPALEFYHKQGFREQRRVPLRSVRTADGIVWEETSGIAGEGRELVHMVHVDS